MQHGIHPAVYFPFHFYFFIFNNELTGHNCSGFVHLTLHRFTTQHTHAHSNPPPYNASSPHPHGHCTLYPTVKIPLYHCSQQTAALVQFGCNFAFLASIKHYSMVLGHCSDYFEIYPIAYTGILLSRLLEGGGEYSFYGRSISNDTDEPG